MTAVERTVDERTSLAEVIKIMKERKWNVIPVIGGDGYLAGVFTRSELYEAILDGVSLTEEVGHYLKRNVAVMPLHTPYEVVEKIVRGSKVGTGVVINEADKVIGLFTKTDMVTALLNETNSLKEQIETIMNTSHLGAVMADGANQIVYVNDRISEMVGLHKEDMLGYEFTKIFEKIDTSKAHMKDIKIREEQFILRLSHYRTVQGKKGVIALFQDRSEVEMIAQELETVKNLHSTLETAIDHAYDGILMIDQKKKITMVSPPLLKLFNVVKEDILGKNVEEVFPQLNLTVVLKSGEADLSDFMEINGIKYIVNRIPVLQGEEVIGVLGKITFRQLNEVNALFKKLERSQSNNVKQAETARFSWDEIITQDPYTKKLKKSAAKAAKGRSTVLIRGESGTGKELFAHAIHNSSTRKDENFVIVNCAAIPEHLLESEFFGYEAGAFTGARQKRTFGKFDMANGGTLFLDEIGDMSLSLQAKLLRVLQEGEFYRVGSTERVHVDVRIIAATNRSLEEMVRNGEFREDLYYRLNVISLQIPPLRKRIADVEILINTIMKELNRLIGTSITGIDDHAKRLLMCYEWPGNIRELRNVLERAMTFSEFGKIQIEDLPDYMIEKVHVVPENKEPKLALAESAELSAIKIALAEADDNKSKAAKLLGISRSGLYEKLKKYGL
ncbi:sigma-54-dependent Fis family transcriptional regulator [Bacillus solimangrovi]|nr:sigma-54-dependent Fis family transcriptional regulator [Bacillus solimangrovi]